MTYQHLNLNLDDSGPSSRTTGLQSPPQTQQQQQQRPQQQQQQHPQQPQQHLGPPPGHAPPQPDHPPPPDEHIPNRPEVPAPGVPAPANPICAPVQPPADPPRVIDQHTTELAALRARIAQLERDADRAPPRPATPPRYVPPVLFADQDTIDRARAAAVASRDSDRKLSLPEIIPGFKASPLDIREY